MNKLKSKCILAFGLYLVFTSSCVTKNSSNHIEILNRNKAMLEWCYVNLLARYPLPDENLKFRIQLNKDGKVIKTELLDGAPKDAIFRGCFVNQMNRISFSPSNTSKPYSFVVRSTLGYSERKKLQLTFKMVEDN